MSETQERPVQVYAAAVANLIIAGSKMTVAVASGSSAMLSEGIHSLADTGNQLLLLLGLKRSRRPPDDQHPFGYGQEIYFWGFVVSITLFSIGGGISMYEGIHRLRHGENVSDPFWSYVVLGIAGIAESFSMYFAVKKFQSTRRKNQSWWEALRNSKDPSIFVVVAEDAAALLGIAVAAAGIVIGQIFRSTTPDAVAAIAIGGILCCVAVALAIETKALLVGESADPEIVSGIMKIVTSDPIVVRAQPPLTMHLGPADILVNMAVEFRSDATGSAILDSIAKFESAIQKQFPRVRRIFIEAECLRHAA
jgi:cation diffusion facilitator family transporter